MTDSSRDIINEFFNRSGTSMKNGCIKKSVLSTILDDMEFCLNVPRRWKSINLTEEQGDKLENLTPTFAIIFLFCTSIDLLARVIEKDEAKIGKNKKFFIKCAMEWFCFSSEEAEKLWELRNCISHQYALKPNYIIKKIGSKKVMEKNRLGFCIFYVRPMLGSLLAATERIRNHLTSEPLDKRLVTENYLLTKQAPGFIYDYPEPIEKSK